MARIERGLDDVMATAEHAGAPDALLQLGFHYSSGLDVGVDLVEAHKWFNLAALRGCAEARRYRAEIAGELSRAEIGDAQRRAREWLGRP
jgi:TPR repeat protein